MAKQKRRYTSISCVTDEDFEIRFRVYLIHTQQRMGDFVRAAIEEKLTREKRKVKNFVHAGSHQEPKED